MSKKPSIPPHSHLVRRDIFQHYEADGEVATEGESYIRHGVRWIGKVWVKHTFRRAGLGRELLRAMVQEYQNAPLWLQVHAYDGQAMPDAKLIQWYTGFGFCATEAPGILMRPAGPLLLE